MTVAYIALDWPIVAQTVHNNNNKLVLNERWLTLCNGGWCKGCGCAYQVILAPHDSTVAMLASIIIHTYLTTSSVSVCYFSTLVCCLSYLLFVLMSIKLNQSYLSVPSALSLPQYSGNPYQMLYLLRKTPTTDYFSSFQNFLDEQQFCSKGIKRYEAIYGDSFVSCGGRQTTEVR